MSKYPRGFHLRKVRDWWIIVPMLELTPFHKIERMEGKSMDMFTILDKHEAVNKVFELMEQIDKLR